MRLSKGMVLGLLAAFIIIAGGVWYLGRGGIDENRDVSEGAAMDSPWATTEEEVDQPPQPPED